MGMRVFLATALMLLTSIAFAEHAISLDAASTPTPNAQPATTQPDPSPVKVAVPARLEVHLVETGSREVCDTFNFGDGDVRTECRTEPLRVKAKDPALRGICITRYGNRTCY